MPLDSNATQDVVDQINFVLIGKQVDTTARNSSGDFVDVFGSVMKSAKRAARAAWTDGRYVARCWDSRFWRVFDAKDQIIEVLSEKDMAETDWIAQ